EAKRDKFDILCVQETHFFTNRIPTFGLREYPTQYPVTHSSKTRGVSFLIHNSLSFEPLQIKKNAQGRFLIFHCMINEAEYTMVGFYGPNDHQRKFLHRLLNKIPIVPSSSLILCGDLNHVLDSHMDTTLPESSPRHSIQ
ncbi:Hypothetical predicted protein, partial [Pelobates cultripes]